MVTLKYDFLDSDISIKDMAMIDTKANMLEAYKIAGWMISKNYTKNSIASIWEDIVNHNWDKILDKLPKYEKEILCKLISLEQHEYVSAPRNDENYLMIQKLYFVLTYQTKDEWHIYMPNCFRELIQSEFGRALEQNPALRYFTNTMEQLTTCNDRMFDLLHNKGKLSYKQQAKEADSIKKEMKKHLNDLKSKESQVKSLGVDAKSLFSMIQEQIELCETFERFAKIGKSELVLQVMNEVIRNDYFKAKPY